MTSGGPSLVSTTENPTRGQKEFSESETADSTSEDSGNDWSRQQRRVFQRTSSMLHYWESHGYEILWLAFTSSPTSKPADELAYSHQKLRQRVERARIARCDGEHCPKHDEPSGHFVSHIDRLEHLQIRTCEGPQGVIHAFWAWQPRRFRDGNHDRSLYIPQSWLSEQWAAIHGADVRLETDDPYIGRKAEMERLQALTESHAPGVVWINEYGDDSTDGDHSHENVASYAASQYLGEHGEALEHLGWSHQRSLGGPLADTWTRLVSFFDDIEETVATWKRVLAGEEVKLTNEPEYGVHYSLVVKPPPNLGYIEDDVTVVPPDDYYCPGPDGETRVVHRYRQSSIDRYTEDSDRSGSA